VSNSKLLRTMVGICVLLHGLTTSLPTEGTAKGHAIIKPIVSTQKYAGSCTRITAAQSQRNHGVALTTKCLSTPVAVAMKLKREKGAGPPVIGVLTVRWMNCVGMLRQTFVNAKEFDVVGCRSFRCFL
jgi:hypothetical protein